MLYHYQKYNLANHFFFRYQFTRLSIYQMLELIGPTILLTNRKGITSPSLQLLKPSVSMQRSVSKMFVVIYLVSLRAQHIEPSTESLRLYVNSVTPGSTLIPRLWSRNIFFSNEKVSESDWVY